MSGLDTVISEVRKYVDGVVKESEIEKSNQQIASLREGKKFLDNAINTKFQYLTENEINLFIDTVSMLRELSQKEKDELYQFYFLLLSNYDSSLETFELARNAIKGYQKEFERTISVLHKQVNLIKANQNLELIDIINKVFKKNDNGSLRLSGNITPEEYDKLITLLENLQISLDERLQFIRELNDCIASFKFTREQLISKIDEEEKEKDLEILTGKSKKSVRLQERRTAPEYNTKRIKNVIEKLSEIYKDELEDGLIVTYIDENTPFDRYRDKLYNKPGTKEIDFRIVLYDLLHFIDPDVVQEKYETGQISGEELDNIRNITYIKIVNAFKANEKNLIIDKLAVKVISQSPKVKESNELFDGKDKPNKEEEVIEELPEQIPVQPIKPVELPGQVKKEEEKKTYINPNVKYLSKEETKLLEDVKEKGKNYIYEFKQKYKYSQSIYRLCLDKETAEHYGLDSEMVRLVISEIPKLIEDYDAYIVFYKQILHDESLSAHENIELLDDYKEDLINLAHDIQDMMETYIIDSPTDNITYFNQSTNNILILCQDITDDTSVIFDDVQEVIRTGQVSLDYIYDGFKKLEVIDTIHPKSPTLRSVKTDKWIENLYNPYRFRDGDLRYVYINITICDENLKELQEAYGINNNNIRLLYVPIIIYMRGNKDSYADATIRIKNICGTSPQDINSIEWVKEIFAKPFTEETRQLAFELINRSQKKMDKIKDGELDNVPRN